VVVTASACGGATGVVAGAAAPGLPGRQCRRLPCGTTMAPTATRAAAASAPPVTENATVRVAELTPRGRGTGTRLAGLVAAACGGSTSVTACTGLIIPAPVCAPVPPAAVAMIRCTTFVALSLG
jgi:hypothetical protein